MTRGNFKVTDMTDAPTCPYCMKPADFFESSASVYHGRDYGPIWNCIPCEAWVACHKGTTTPLGRLADKTLRKAKIEAHAAFDPLWQAKQRKANISKGHARGKGYKWLAEQLKLDPKDCHVGMFDVATCKRVVEICKPFADRLRRQ